VTDFASPFNNPLAALEPPVGTVIAYQVSFDGLPYEYVSVRCADGKWYTTGAHSEQHREWYALTKWLRRNGVDSVRYATGWSELRLVNLEE